MAGPKGEGRGGFRPHPPWPLGLRWLRTDWGMYFEIGTRNKGFTQSLPNFGPNIPHWCSLALYFFLFGDGINWHKKWCHFAIFGQNYTIFEANWRHFTQSPNKQN